MQLQDYDLNFVYCPGKDNEIADFLVSIRLGELNFTF